MGRREGKILRDDAIFMESQARKESFHDGGGWIGVPAIYFNPCRVIKNFNSTVEAVRTQRMTDAVKYTFYLSFCRLERNCFYVSFSFASLIVNY